MSRAAAPTWQFRWSYSRGRYVYRYTSQWGGEPITCDGFAVVDDFGNLVVVS